MLTALLGVAFATAAVSGAALVKPVDGAFGIRFGEPVALELLGAATVQPAYPAPPDNLGLHDGLAQRWHHFTPDETPVVLGGRPTRYQVMVDASGRPIRIVAERPKTDCQAAFDWIVESIGRKYSTSQDPQVQPRNGFLHGARFHVKQRQVDVACGRSLLVEYTDLAALLRWQGEQRALSTTAKERALITQRASERIAERRLKQFADEFTLGDPTRLEGALGVAFGQPYPGATNQPADMPFAVALSELPTPFAAGTYELTVDPAGHPVRLEGSLRDGSGGSFEMLRDALRAKYGAPMKDTARHVIHRVNGNLFVLRRLAGIGELSLVVIDAQAQRAQRARVELASQQAFERAARGL